MTSDSTGAGEYGHGGEHEGSGGAGDVSAGRAGSGAVGRSVSWAGVLEAEPVFARRVADRFGMFKHHILGTLRKDGAPRLSGLEADFRYGELWLGMLSGSRKALDLRRDPRFSLHANPGAGADLAGGDVRVSGRAVEVTDPGVIARYAAEVRPPEPFHLFRAELTEVVRTSVEAPYLLLESWQPGRPLRTVRRRSAYARLRVD